MPLGTVLFGTNESNGTVQGSECAAFRDPDRREGRAEGHAQVARKRRMDDAMKFEKLCRENAKQYIEYLKADQYYLIRATNPAADRFYHHFENAELSETPLLRKMCQKEPSPLAQEGELR